MQVAGWCAHSAFSFRRFWQHQPHHLLNYLAADTHALFLFVRVAFQVRFRAEPRPSITLNIIYTARSRSLSCVFVIGASLSLFFLIILILADFSNDVLRACFHRWLFSTTGDERTAWTAHKTIGVSRFACHRGKLLVSLDTLPIYVLVLFERMLCTF